MNRSEAFAKDNEFLVLFDTEKQSWVVAGDKTKFVYEAVPNKFLAEKAAKRLTKLKTS